MKKILITVGLIAGSLYANTPTQINKDRDVKELLSCIVEKITDKQKKAIKEYAFLNLSYPDKDIRKMLNIKEEQIKKITTNAGAAIVELIENKCRDKTKKLFTKNSLQDIYLKLALVINRVITYSLLDKKDKDNQKEKKLTKWFEEALLKKKFSNFIYKLYLEKKAQEENKKK